MPSLSVNKNGLILKQAGVIIQTLLVVSINIEKVTPNFYNRMFTAHPELIADALNRGNQKQDIQQKAPAASVTTFVATPVDPDAPAPEKLPSRIGHKHASIDIKLEQYPIVYKHLLDTIEEIPTPEIFQGAICNARGVIYLEMQHVLISFERGLYGDLGVEAGDVSRAACIISCGECGNDVVVFSAKLNYESPVSYLLGQYIPVRQAMLDGVRQPRQYSLAGDREGVLTFAVRRIDTSEDLPADETSTQLWEKVQPSDVIETFLSTDDLVLDTKSDDPAVLISADIDTTSMTSVLNALMATDSKRDVTVLHVGRAETADVLRVGRDNAVAVLANTRRQAWYGPDLMDLTDADLSEGVQYYLCGGNGSLQAVRKQLVDHGVDHSNVHFELSNPNDWLLSAQHSNCTTVIKDVVTDEAQ